ncbi:site-specific integrase [Vagococcus xieshaowenii]|uniref:Site-specific integrase n=1 Tax=Vagococcus xieshaowenii TaxID=2562451 RepID=A0A4Z0D7I4_9ENTE|nr:site-specific integrase [Vagococcus xieshaowenii]QCA29171.1 site-specific integrase [Vagococcus xieshaowenii]TFZ40851.1 site-specific integrase [Vagococcus xieshaowenii]
MATIKKYTKSNGEAAYMFNMYVGVDPLTGKKKRTTRRGFKTQKEAKLALARLELEIEEEGLKQVTNLTYQELYALWFDQYKQTVKESTWATTASEFKHHILPSFKDMRVNSINMSICQKIANNWALNKPNRYRRFIHYASLVFKYGLQTRVLKDNPMDQITMPKPQETFSDEEETENFFSREELLFFLDFVKENFSTDRYLFFHLLAFTGIRKGEALALNWSDIDFKEKQLSIVKTLAVGEKGRLMINTPKTKNSIRKITLDDDTLFFLKKWRQEQQSVLNRISNTLSLSQLVFPGVTNDLLQPNIPTEWIQTIYRHLKKNGHDDFKRITVHGFRHTHCSLLFEAGVSIKEVQVRLGHSNIKTTLNIYTHLTQEVKAETANTFANFMKNESRGIQKGIQKGSSH